MADYTVTIAQLAGATITRDRDNITNVSLTVSSSNGSANDPYNLSLQVDDTVTWEVDSSLRDWHIQNIIIGRYAGNENIIADTEGVFSGTHSITEEISLPANISDVRGIVGSTPTTTIQEFEVTNSNRVAFTYRIRFTGSSDWWIDPEIDVTPAGSSRSSLSVSGGTSTPLGPVRTTTLYAVVVIGGDNTDVMLQRGVGAVSAVRGGTGSYTVTFNVDVSLGCFTVTGVTIGSPPSVGSFSASLGSTNEVIVTYRNPYNFYRIDLTEGQGFFLNVTTSYGAQSMT